MTETLESDPRRERDSAIRNLKRRLIVEAAERVFAARGLEGATMRGIATEAGCTTGGVYPFFDGKDGLYAEVLRQSMTRLNRILQESLDDSPPEAAARSVLHAFFDYYRDRPHEVAMGLYLYRGEAGRKGLSEELDAELNAVLLETLEPIDKAFMASFGVSEEKAQKMRGRAFVHLIGLLILLDAGRLKLLDIDPRADIDRFVQDMARH